MGLELILFITAVLCGVFIYWTESKSNKTYRFFNKIVNSKALQMQKNNPKGFVFKQAFIPRLLFIISIVLITALIIQFITPIPIFTSFNGISAFSSFIFGMLLGTYLANIIVTSSVVIEEKTEVISDMVEDAFDKGETFIEKGKGFIEDLTSDTEETTKLKAEDVENATNNEKPISKSARERLKNKGLM